MTRFALCLAALALLGHAGAAFAQSGEYRLSGAYEGGVPTSATLQVSRVAGRFVVTRIKRDGEPQTWRSLSVKRQKNGRLRVLYASPQQRQSAGAAGALRGHQASTAAGSETFRATYYFRGDKVREHVQLAPGVGGQAPRSLRSEGARTPRREQTRARVEEVVTLEVLSKLGEYEEETFLLARGADQRLLAFPHPGGQSSFREGDLLQFRGSPVADSRADVINESWQEEGYGSQPRFVIAEGLAKVRAADPQQLFSAFESEEGSLQREFRLPAPLRAELAAVERALAEDHPTWNFLTSTRELPTGFVTRLKIRDELSDRLDQLLAFDREGNLLGTRYAGAEGLESLSLQRQEQLKALADFAENAGESRTLDPSDPTELAQPIADRIKAGLPRGEPFSEVTQQGVGRVVGYTYWDMGNRVHYFDLRGRPLGTE